MPFDALGNYIPDEEVTLDEMQYELAKRGSMPLRPDGSDVPYLASEVPKLRVPITPKEPPKPYSTSTDFAQAMADRLGISAIPQALMAMGAGFGSEVAKGMGYKDASKAMQYQPTSRMATDILAGLEEAPKAITGSHMGFGPMPETWITGLGNVSPSDVRVLGKQAIETGRELRAIPEDFRNAQAGVRRESNLGGETYGAKLQGVAEDVGDVMARQQARRNRYETYPKSSVEVFGGLVPDTKMYAVRNTGEGQMLRPSTSAGGVEPRNVDYGDTEQYLREIAPALSVNKPEEIIDQYEASYMSENTPAVRKLNEDWERFQADKIKEMYPSHFSKAESFKALRTGYPANVIQDMKLKWLSEYINQKKEQGFEIPSMEEYYARAQAANSLTKKIIPNIIQKYIGTPNDPFLESAKQGITMTPADEFVQQYLDTPSSLEKVRREAGFEPQGQVADKLMPIAESKLATQNAELDRMIAEQSEIGRTEGMMVPYPDGRIDPETGAVMLATNPNYAQYTNKIGAMRKAIEDTEQEVQNLKLAQAYENVADSSIKTATASDYRMRIPAEQQQFFPSLYSEKPKTTAISPTTYKTPDTAPFFETNVQGLRRAGILPLAEDLVKKIMSGEIPPDQVPNLSQPHTLTKYMGDIVAPRLEKEKAAKLAMKDYKVNVQQHFIDVVNAIPDSMKVGTNAKLLWIDDATPMEEINQALSDETFVLDHCIGNSGNGSGLTNLFTGDQRSYIPFMDPATGQKFKNAGGTSSYMDDVANGEKDIMMIRDIKTGMPVGTIELSREVDADGEFEYRIGYVSGYKNHNNKFKGIDPKYREALRDSLNMVRDNIVSSADNENQSGVYDIRSADQMQNLTRKLDLPGNTSAEKNTAWKGIKKSIMDNLDGDRFITLDQAEDAVKEYKTANPPVPAVRQAQPDRANIEQRNIVMQGLSRENLDTSRQFNASRLVSNNSRFIPYPTAESEMEIRPFRALRTILDEERARSDQYSVNNPIGAFSDYQLFRNLQNMVDAIDQGDMRFADFGLGGHSELLDLREGLQKQADAIGQLAHYADVLQRNGYRSPLPSEQTGAPEWQTYQRYIGELGIDNPRDLRTRLEDTINHADLREIDPQLDEVQRANLRQLLAIHSRSVKQAMDYPAPTATAEQRGIPLTQWADLVHNTLQEIGTNFGDGTRQAVSQIVSDAINYQMDVPANERPVQMSNYLTSQAREAVNPVAVRNALRVMAGAIDQANADIQNARNAPATTTALPSISQYGDAIARAEQDIPANTWGDVSEILNNIQNEIVRDGGMYHQHPATIVQRLDDEANAQEAGGEPDTATGLRNLATEIARLVPANPPASMALANQPTRQVVAGQEVLSNSIMDAMNDEPALAPAISDRLNALQWRENLVNDPAGLVRNIRIEADAETRAGDERFASSLYDIANLIADENGETLFTPAGRQLQAPTQSSRDLAISTEEQRNTNRVEQVVALTDGIDRQLEEISDASRYGLMGLVDLYADANQLPDNITDHTNSFDDAVRIANYLRQHAQARLDAMPPDRNNQLTTAGMPTPRDVALSIPADSMHQSLEQRQAQVQQITEGINNEIRSLPTREPGLSQALEFYRDYDNLPTDMMARIPSQEDAETVLSHIRQHIQNRIDNLPENRGQGQQLESEGFFRRLNHIIDDTVLTASNNPAYANIQDMPNVLEREINAYHQNSENLSQFIQYLRDDLDNVTTNHLGDNWHDRYADEIRHLIDRLRRLQVDMPEMSDTLTFHQDAEPAQLPAPARDIDQQIQGFRNAVASRAQAIEASISPEASQSFLSIVDMARNEYDPITNPSGFTRSLSHRAYSVRNNQAYADMAEPLANELFSFAREYNQQPAPALTAPAQVDNGNNFEQMRRIEDAITNRGLMVNQNHLGSSQQFDTLVEATRRQFNPLVDTVNFISSLHDRANSVDRVGNREAQVLANMLRGLADDVNNELTRQVPALPAPPPNTYDAYVQRAYDVVSDIVRNLHSYMIDDVQRNPLTRANLTDVIRNDLDRYGLSGSSPQAIEGVLNRIRDEGIAPVVDPVAQHFERVEQGVNQPEGLGALDRNTRNMANMYSTNLLNGDRNALTGLAPQERQMVEVLTRFREPEETVINPLDHRRLINTLTSETYNPATDGETLIRLARNMSGMFANLNTQQAEQVIDIVNKWNFTRFPNYAPPEEGMGLDPEGRKRGGYIRKRKMNEGGQPKLTPYEQFKIDNAERIRQGQEDIANRNKYDPYKGTDRPIPTQKGASGSAGVIPSGSGPSSLDRPRLYSIGGKVYMEVGGQVKPVPDIPATPEKTRPNTTDHVVKRPVDPGFKEVLERVRNTPRPSGSAGTMPSGSGASYLDRPHLYANGGNVNIDAMRLALMKG